MPSLQIRFDGDWTQTEQRVLESAIADAEASLLSCASGERSDHRSWICYCKRLSGMSVYLAHRTGWQRVLHAFGATELGMKILLVGQNPPDDADGYNA